MHPMDQHQAEIQELKKEIRQLQNQILEQNDRLRGVWWKMGLMAGIVAMISAEVFGSGIGGIVNIILGGF